MNDIFVHIQTNKETFKDFRVWLFVKLGKNQKTFTTFGSYPNFIKSVYLLEYLELKGTPMVEALVYYNCVLTEEVSFPQLLNYVIIMEFKRLEDKKIIDYTPF